MTGACGRHRRRAPPAHARSAKPSRSSRSATAGTAPSSARAGPSAAKAHGGLLLVLLARAGLARLDAEAPGLGARPARRRAPTSCGPPTAGPVELAHRGAQDWAAPRRWSSVRMLAGRPADAGRHASPRAGCPTTSRVWAGPARACRPNRPRTPPTRRRGGPSSAWRGSCDLRFDPATIGVPRAASRARRCCAAGSGRAASRPTCCSRCSRATSCRRPCSTSAGASAGRPPCSSPRCCAAPRRRAGCGSSRRPTVVGARGSTRTSPWSTRRAG